MKPSLGDVIADKYRLDRVLGEGGMSTVYAATNEMTGKNVAIKWLNPEVVHDDELCQRLLREAKATSAIDHPNVVNVFDVGRHEGALFLVMELLYGEPLSALLTRYEHTQMIAPEAFVRLMMPVMRGVHAAHRVGVVHRDLKPDNIFLCRDPHDDGELREPKVLDFGISKLIDKSMALGTELTREGTVFGTPQYMAPEQMRDARVADVRSDVYALGVIFYRALSKRYPYDADTLSALAIRVVEGNATPLHELCPHVDLGLSDIIMRALAVDPEQRMQSVAALAHALEPHGRGPAFTRGVPERIGVPTWQLERALDQSGSHPIGGSSPTDKTRPPGGDTRPASHADDLYIDDSPTEALTLEDIILELDPEHREEALRSFGASARVALATPASNDGGSFDVGPPTVRTERFWTRTRKRRALLIGVVLFAIGAAAPVALQRDEPPARPAGKAPPEPREIDGTLQTGRPSFALGNATDAHDPPIDLTAVTTTPLIVPEREPAIDTPPLTSFTRKRRSVHTDSVPDSALPVMPESDGLVIDSKAEGRKAEGSTAANSTVASGTLPLDATATTDAISPELDLTIPVDDALPTLKGERNPYLRR